MPLDALIEPTIPVLKPSDTVDDALRMIAETHLEQLPLVNGKQYLGMIKESILLDWENPDDELLVFEGRLNRLFCHVQLHPFEAVKMAIQNKFPVVPVLNQEQEYLGSISRDALFYYLGENGSLNEPGGIIVLEMKLGDYSLGQIARICEGENVIILNSRVYTNPQTGMLEVTLKTNKQELQTVVAAFERFEYTVKEVYGDLPAYDDLAQRYKLLMTYINM
ncbi:CBS domain protein [compost metagenome]